MSDLIPLAELLAEIDREIKRVPACAATLQRARSIALTIPTIDAAPVVHAYWRRKEYNIDGEITFGTACSECGAGTFSGLYAAKYCYKCGARMDADAPERAGKEREGG